MHSHFVFPVEIVLSNGFHVTCVDSRYLFNLPTDTTSRFVGQLNSNKFKTSKLKLNKQRNTTLCSYPLSPFFITQRFPINPVANTTTVFLPRVQRLKKERKSRTQICVGIAQAQQMNTTLFNCAQSDGSVVITWDSNDHLNSSNCHSTLVNVHDLGSYLPCDDQISDFASTSTDLLRVQVGLDASGPELVRRQTRFGSSDDIFCSHADSVSTVRPQASHVVSQCLCRIIWFWFRLNICDEKITLHKRHLILATKIVRRCSEVNVSFRYFPFASPAM